MKQEATLIRARLKTPRAAVVAGILFSVLLITGLLLFRLSVRTGPLDSGSAPSVCAPEGTVFCGKYTAAGEWTSGP